MKHPGHMYGGFVSAISERGMTWQRFINVLVTEEEARGRPFDEGEMKGVGHRFGSTPMGCGKATDGGARSGGKPGSCGSVGGGRRP
jgi:hypothetical protein